MDSEIPEHVREYIISRHTLTLGTTAAGEPWVTPLFYVADPMLRLYVVSDPQTLHCRQALAEPRVAVAIYDHVADWQSIRGVQLTGRMTAVAAADRRAVEKLYAARFPFVSGQADGAAPAAGAGIQQRFADAGLFVITPAFVRYIDNRRGFGYREEYTVPAPK